MQVEHEHLAEARGGLPPALTGLDEAGLRNLAALLARAEAFALAIGDADADFILTIEPEAITLAITVGLARP